MPAKDWRKEKEKNQYIFITQVNFSKIYQPLFRDIPGDYTINLGYEVEPEKTDGRFWLEVIQNGESLGVYSQEQVEELYDEVNMKMH